MKKSVIRVISLSLAFVLACGLFSGCGKKNAVFKIGFCGALTGSSAAAGESALAGIQQAVAEINENGGINGVKVEVVYRDDESDATKNLTYVEELIDKEQVDLLFGAVNSGSCSASLDIINEAQIIEIITDASSTSLVDVEKYPYTFRNVLTNGPQGEFLVQHAKDGGHKRIVVIGDSTDLGKDGFALTKASAEVLGVEIVDYFSYTANDSDLTAVAQSIVNAKADCIIAWAYASDAAKIVKALDRLDYMDKVTIYGYSGMYSSKLRELVGDIDCSRITSLGGFHGFILEHGDEKLKDEYQHYYDLVDELYGEYKKDGSGRTVTLARFMRAYDSVYLIKWLIEEKTGGSYDGDSLKNAIEKFGAEYDCKHSDYHYTYSADNHDGFNMDDCYVITMVDPLENEYIAGDLPYKYAGK